MFNKMKNLLIILAALILSSCSQSPLEKSLANQVDSTHVKKYKLISYNIVDTFTVAKKLESYSDLTFIEPNKEEFIKQRNQEFVTLRKNPAYEEQVMTGELKDASSWCTQISLYTEKADSLLANWVNVTNSTYDYIYLHIWYLKRFAQFYSNYTDSWKLDIILDNIVSDKERYAEYNRLLTLPKDSILSYSVIHNYSIYNPLFEKRIPLVDSVIVTPDMKVVEVFEKTKMLELLEQIAK